MVSILLSNSHGKLAKSSVCRSLDISTSINSDALTTSVSYKPTDFETKSVEMRTFFVERGYIRPIY